MTLLSILIGLWHVTVGHPMNPIMTMGNLICTGVDVTFPEDTLSYGDFPTAIKAVVKLKPAMPRDRAGIEMMFNHGRKRIYMPAVVKVVKDQKMTDTRRGLWDKYVVGPLDAVTIEGIDATTGRAINKVTEITRNTIDAISEPVSAANKYVQDKVKNDWKGWIDNKKDHKDGETKLVQEFNNGGSTTGPIPLLP